MGPGAGRLPAQQVGLLLLGKVTELMLSLSLWGVGHEIFEKGIMTFCGEAVPDMARLLADLDPL
eukprot:jgi/Tetstr1/460209/TSEL_005524.t1